MKYIIQENTLSHGWEDIDTVDEAEAQELIRVYREANPGISFKLKPIKPPVTS
jgi:hypothetical protein